MKNSIKLNQLTTITAITWTVIWIALCTWVYIDEESHSTQEARRLARAALSRDTALRHWGADHGGIYVEVNKSVQPDPNLKNIPERDIKTPSGRTLTLINPAYMLRQVMNDFPEKYGLQGRITSLKPLLPANAPDQWERKVLLKFEEGTKEVIETTSINGKPYLRLMQPLVTTKGCLKCHAAQGYHEGDIQGGVGINVSLTVITANLHRRANRQVLYLSLFWLIGMIGLTLKGRELKAIQQKQLRYIQFAERGKELGFILIDETPLPIMLQQCAELLNTHLGTFFLQIWLSDPTEKLANLTATAGKHPHITDKHQIKKLDKNNLIGRIALDGKTYVSNQPQDEPLFLDQEWLIEQDIQAFAGMPLQTNNRSYGVIGCFKQQAIEQEEISLLEPLVDKIALGIARKYSEVELQKSHDNLEKDIIARTRELTEIHIHVLQSEKLAAIGRLSASIAHEFNNPLAGITAVIQGIKRRATYDNDDAELLNMALKECNRIKKLILSLKDFSRPNSSTMALIDITALFDSILLLNQYEFKTHGITLKTHFAKNMPQIMAMADQLKQLFLNLLSNAIDACRQGGSITISTHSDNENYIITIADTGIGIKPEDMNHIFEPFFSTKPAVKGTGLGLSICYGYVKNRGGEIQIHSERTKGTTVSVSLPIKFKPTKNSNEQKISSKENPLS